jgi:hypothetical protein
MPLPLSRPSIMMLLTPFIPATIYTAGLCLTPSKIGLVKEAQSTFTLHLLHFDFVAQWEAFRGGVIFRQVFLHEDTSLPMQLFFFARFTIIDFDLVWMLIKGYINTMCGEVPTALRMGVPPPTTSFVGLSGKLTETQRQGVTINAPYQSRQDACKLEDYLEMQPQRFVMLGINVDTYTAVVWVTSQFLGPLNIWWLNRKLRASIPYTFDSLVTITRKTSLLPNIRDDAINALIRLT